MLTGIQVSFVGIIGTQEDRDQHRMGGVLFADESWKYQLTPGRVVARETPIDNITLPKRRYCQFIQYSVLSIVGDLPLIRHLGGQFNIGLSGGNV